MEEMELQELTKKLSLDVFNKPFVDEVYFNHRLRTTGGRYLPRKRVVELNPKYLKELGYEDFVGIIKHELCHYHLHIEGKGYQHRDREFRQLLKETNSPRFCNPLPSMKKDFKYFYECKKCSHIYRRKRKMDIRKYRCGKCKGKLQISENKSINTLD